MTAPALCPARDAPHLHFLQPGMRSHCAGALSRVFLHRTELGPEGYKQVPFLGGMGSPPQRGQESQTCFWTTWPLVYKVIHEKAGGVEL